MGALPATSCCPLKPYILGNNSFKTGAMLVPQRKKRFINICTNKKKPPAKPDDADDQKIEKAAGDAFKRQERTHELTSVLERVCGQL